jgi:murein DD-endopeptidase MepM/ murein hydrolase activator NlpD
LTLTNAQNLQWDNSNNAIGVSGTTMTFTVNSGNRATLDSTALTLLSGVDLRIPTQTPASASATGTVGTIAWDGSFLYVATGSDTWKRVAIATW